MDNSILMPTSEDAVSFRKAVEAGFTKKNALSPAYLIDFDSETREKVLSHKFYKWLASERKFQKVLNYLSAKNLESEFPDRRKIEMAYCVATLYPGYYFYSSNPEKLASTTEATGSKALKNTDALLDLLDCGLQMESLSDITSLRILLLRLKLELSGKLPTTYSKSKHGDLLGMRLVMDIHNIIKDLIGEAPTFVICQLVSIMHNVSEQQVRRYIKAKKTIS